MTRIFWLLALSAFGSCEDLRALIAKTYVFKPSQLKDDAEFNAKSAQMDAVWNMATAAKAELAPCLRTELEKASPSSWFFFDGSALLLQIAPSTESRALRLRALENVDLADVSLQIWASNVAALGAEGLDTRGAAERWLREKDPKYSVPQHAFTVNAFTGAMILYGSMSEEFATPALIAITNDDKHPGRSTAVRLLLDQATPAAWSALGKLDTKWLPSQAQKIVAQTLKNRPKFKPRAMPKTTREKYLAAFNAVIAGDGMPFANLMSEVPDGELDAVAVLKPEDVPLLRQVRRRLMSIGNQHQIETCRFLTIILYTLTP